MSCYVIACVLRAAGFDYGRFHELLASWDAVKLQDAMWLADLIGPSNRVRDQLLSLLHPDDTLSVLQIFPHSEWATWRAGAEGVAWLRERMG